MVEQQRIPSRLPLGASALIAMLVIGACNGEEPVEIEEPVFIVGGTNPRADQTCNAEFEAVPCLVPGNSTTPLFAALGFNRMSVAEDGWDGWTGGGPGTDPGFAVPINPSDPLNLASLTGDAYTTFSSSKNLAFVYFIGRPSTQQNSCVAVAATPPQKLPLNEWDFPATCLSGSRGDQCAILHVDATNTFYAACAHGDVSGSTIRIQAFDDCQDAPGPAYGCPRTAIAEIEDANILQFSLSTNPCTDHLVVVYRNLRSEVRLRFYDENLRRINRPDFLVRANQRFGFGQTNQGCRNGTIRRCGLGGTDCCNPNTTNCQNDAAGQCLRVNGRPSVDVHREQLAEGAECRAAVAYDALVRGRDGNLWSKSRLDVVRITDESMPQVEHMWNSTSNEFTWNQYLSYATVNFFQQTPQQDHNLAWIWISDNQGACQLGVEGAVSRDLGNTMTATGKFSGPFPGVYVSSFGINDYNRGVQGGDPLGYLYAAWGEPVPTTGACTPCMGQRWNLAARMTSILP